MPSQRPQNAEQARLVNNAGLNHPDSYNNQGYNSFDRSETVLQTQRFADVNPIYPADLIPGERPRIVSQHELRTFTLRSPLLSDVYMHRSFFVVPLQAIYPNTWKIQIKPRPWGSDIPDLALPGLEMILVKGNSYSVYTTLCEFGRSQGSSETHWFELFLLFIQMFSQDGLLHKLGYGFPDYGVDDLVNIILNEDSGQLSFVVNYTYDNGNQSSSIDLADTSISLDKRRFVFYEILNNHYQVTSFNAQGSNQSDWAGDGSGVYDGAMKAIFDSFPSWSSSSKPVVLERLIAYQMICAQFFTNPYVDNVVTGKQWLDNQMSLEDSLFFNIAGDQNQFTTFVLNGVTYRYDFGSVRSFRNLFGKATSGLVGTTLAQRLIAVRILRNLFEIHSSLRHTDYFVDARVQPLAVGDAYAAVANNQVSAININESLWLQRLYNAVQRIPDNVVDYIRQMFGHDPQSKEPQPMRISAESFLLNGQEVENTTSDSPGTVVSLLRSQQSNYSFEFKVTEHCVLLGLNSYSMSYCYASAMERVFYNRNRLERFNPYTQHFGDQPIYFEELCNDARSNNFGGTFGYQLRYAEYKNGLNRCSGAFAHGDLPSWSAIFDRSQGFNYRVLSSEFIRNNNYDFDQFYYSLTGYNPCEYFHFICKFKTIVNSNSQQQKYPSLM